MFRISLNRLLSPSCKNLISCNNNNVLRNHLYRSVTFPNYVGNLHTNIITSQKQVSVDSNKFDLSEQEYFIKVQNDPDSFGASSVIKVQDELDEGDAKEDQYLSNPPNKAQKLSTKQYADIIKELIRKKRIKEAIDVLEIRMLKEDKVKPENYVFNLVLGACGRVGYTKKAFSLYNQMKKRALAITPGTHTALFNACANSPWPEDGLTRATHLRNTMIEQHIQPNDTNYNAMIKAFGRCGDLNTAFALVDEMMGQGVAIKDDSINFLLQACISDKEAGFRHALLVWRKMIDKRIAPSSFTYNLMLRSIRDCGLGDLDVTTDVIKKLLPDNDRFQLQLSTGNDNNKDNLLTLPDDNIYKCDDECKLMIKTDEIIANRPNLMAQTPHLGDILSLSEVKKAEDRLLLVGGANAFLKSMSDNKCTPDIKTFTQLLDSIPSTIAAENELVACMRKAHVKADVDFYNMLIKKRSLRFDYEAAKAVVDVLKKAKMQPNLITFGLLALGCKNKEEAIALIEQMQNEHYRLNAEILGAMLQQACYHNNFLYVMEVMQVCQNEEIAPNAKFIAHLDTFKKKCKYYVDEEKSYTQTQFFKKGYQAFKLRYKSWREEIKLEENVHPWTQFRENKETSGHFLDKERNSRFKQKHASLFRQKTSAKFDYEDNTKTFTKIHTNKFISHKNYDDKRKNMIGKETWAR